jgi:oligopeptide transport system ATP-binding protein
VPSALRPPSGCRFHPRCPEAMDVCRSVDPVLTPSGEGRSVACHLVHPPATATVVQMPRSQAGQNPSIARTA